MTTGQKKTTNHCSQTSCTLVKVSASIENCKHIAKTQATLAKIFTNLKMSRERVVPPPHESMDNGPSLFDYGLDDPYNDLIDNFDSYLE